MFQIKNHIRFCLLLVGTPEDLICSTSAGQLGCKQIIHARFKGSTQRIRSTCKKILQLCENKGYGSVAFPAINTGLYKLICVSLNTYLLTVGNLLGEEKEKVKIFVLKLIISLELVFSKLRQQRRPNQPC